MLKVIDVEKSKSLLHRMDDAGCVFNFVVLRPEINVTVDESIHRQALTGLHEKLMKDSWDWHNDLIKNPEYINPGDPAISWELDKAVANVLSREEIHNLILVEDYERGPLAFTVLSVSHLIELNSNEESLKLRHYSMSGVRL
ncbi:hypothetical protein [Pseudomonas sp. C9]|uniref:hypothetical protein n=1 Tax=Pseudomonas sp. C9 TaxID=1311337 RepID=UPI002115679A|nr:hypothetical protein [Pseudomonas sp. C9]